MKLSENTLAILKNFSSINPSLLVRPGNMITTMLPSKTIFAKAVVEESFPQQFAVYDMSKFLGVLSLFKEPEIDFGEKSMKISSGKNSTSFTYADPSMIIHPPDKEIAFPDHAVEFNMTAEDHQKVVRASGVLQVPDVVVEGRDGKIYLSAMDTKTPALDKFSIEVGETPMRFSVVFKADIFIKLISKDYTVKINRKGITKFETDGLLYFVAAEANSHFED